MRRSDNPIPKGQNESAIVNNIANKNTKSNTHKLPPSVNISERDTNSNNSTSHALIAENSALQEKDNNSIDSSENSIIKKESIAKIDENSKEAIDFKYARYF